MQKKLESVKFTLNKQMLSLLIEFNSLKQELKYLKERYLLDKNNDKLLFQINYINKKMEKIKKSFIKEFRKQNKKEIIYYLEIKDQ